jgi:hypothetical protein
MSAQSAPESTAPEHPRRGIDADAVRQWALARIAGIRDAPHAGSAEWCVLEDNDPRKTASALWGAIRWAETQAELIAFLASDEAGDLDRLAEKNAAVAVSLAGGKWGNRGPSYAELQRRRSEIGPHARTIDPEATARWVETGSSKPPAIQPTAAEPTVPPSRAEQDAAA